MIEHKIKENFIQEFRETCVPLPGVLRIEFFGSFNTEKWRHGESDIDIIVHGQNIPGNVKYNISQLLRTLNDKYDLRLEKVRCAHPTPFFLDSPQRIELFKKTMSGHSKLVELGQRYIKQYGPTYEEIWKYEDAVKKFEKFFPVPSLRGIFDKFR